MGVQKITFDGANVSAKVDADLHHFLFSNEIGILNGLKSSVGFTLANNTITFTDGYVVIYGRLIYIEPGTSVSVTPNASRMGLVVLGVNTSSNEVSIYTKEQSGSYPTLIRNNLLNSNGTYELALCAYTKTTTSVTLNSYSRMMINSAKVQAFEQRTEIFNALRYERKSLSKISNGVFRFTVNGSQDIDSALVVAMVNSGTSVVVPGAMMFINVGSNTFVRYDYGSSSYTMVLTYENNNVTISLSNTTHNVTALFLYR